MKSNLPERLIISSFIFYALIGPSFALCLEESSVCSSYSTEGCCIDGFSCVTLEFDTICRTCHEECCNICTFDICIVLGGGWPPEVFCTPYSSECNCRECNYYPCNCYTDNYRCSGQGVACDGSSGCSLNCVDWNDYCNSYSDGSPVEQVSFSYFEAIQYETNQAENWIESHAGYTLTNGQALFNDPIPFKFVQDGDGNGHLRTANPYEEPRILETNSEGIPTKIELANGDVYRFNGDVGVITPTTDQMGDLEGQVLTIYGYEKVQTDTPEETWTDIPFARCNSCQVNVYGGCYNFCSGSDTNCGCTSCENCNLRDTLTCFGNKVFRQDGYCSNRQCLYRITTVADDCCARVVSAIDGDSGDGNNSATTNACHGGTAAGCQSDTCYTTSKAGTFTDHCSGSCHNRVNGCNFTEYFPSQTVNSCPGNSECGLQIYDADTNSNTCLTCKTQIDGTLGWSLGCASGNDCSAHPAACCGDDSSEWSRFCLCNPNACTCPPATQACCIHSDSCVWNNGCFVNGHSQDMDSDTMTEYCRSGIWYTYPRIEWTNTDISIVDRDKETLGTNSMITFTTYVYDQDNSDLGHVYITISNSLGAIEVNSYEMVCNYTDSNHWTCIYIYDPRNDAPLGYYSAHIIAHDNEGLTNSKDYPDKFKVEDLSVSASWLGNTTDTYFNGSVNYLSDGAAVGTLIDQRCSEPTIADIPDGNYDTRRDANSSELRLCGVNGFNPSTCTLGSGSYNCYIQDIKLSQKNAVFSYMLTDHNHISGSVDVAVNIDGSIDYFDADDGDTYVNVYQNITYFVNFTNTGDIGWWGRVFNQTRLKIYSPGPENTLGSDFVHTHYSDSDSYVDLPTGGQKQMSFFKQAHFQVGKYFSVADLRYFWPEFYNDYGYNSFNYSITDNSTTYYVAAIDITHHRINSSVLRGQLLTGEIGGFFVASTDMDYWEVIQAFKYRVTNKTATGKFWVDRINLSNNNSVAELTVKNMTWKSSENFYEAIINTFDISCDSNDTIHRVYYQINWTDYDIYIPYVDGVFDPSYYPYYYHDFKVRCTGRELFSVEPSIVNVPVGTSDRDIINIMITNPKNNSMNVDLLIVSKSLDEFVNWLEFRGDTGYCQAYYDNTQGCRDTNLTVNPTYDILNPGENSTVLHLLKASRAGSYEFELILKDRNSGEEIGRKRIVINVLSEAIGNDKIVGLVLLFVIIAGFVIVSLRGRKQQKSENKTEKFKKHRYKREKK